MMRRFWLASLAVLLTLVWLASTFWARERAAEAKTPEAAGKAKSDGTFLRVVRTDKGQPLAMETSIARYVPKDGKSGVVVELVSAVHVGERDYYAALNKAFEGYDVVLYELVAPEGTRVPKGGGKAKSVVSGLQNSLKDLLDLEFQLNEVEYTRDNFVHADMSPEAFAKAMADRGESIWGMMFKMMGHAMAQQMSNKNAPNDLDVLMALFSPNRALEMKRLMAGQFENLETLTTALGGPDGSTLIEGRNRAALAVLKKQLDGGKKKIAIFYGAGHMPAFERQLAADFGLKFDSERWLEAWNLRDKRDSAKGGVLGGLKRAIEQ
jgi:hypothetical protein